MLTLWSILAVAAVILFLVQGVFFFAGFRSPPSPGVRKKTARMLGVSSVLIPVVMLWPFVWLSTTDPADKSGGMLFLVLLILWAPMALVSWIGLVYTKKKAWNEPK